jgi:hypothetical protein
MHEIVQLQRNLGKRFKGMYRIHLAYMASSHRQTNGPGNYNTVVMLANTSKGSVTVLFRTYQRTQLLSTDTKHCETIGTWISAR